MRNINKTEDVSTLKLLKEGADAAKQTQAASAAARSELEDKVGKQFAQMADQIRMLQYALGNVFKTLGDFPNVKAQIDQLDYRTLGIARACQEVKLADDFNALVEKHAKSAKVDAFNELSDADDKNRNLTVADGEALTEQHFVVMTSECAEDNDQGVFRSKMDVGSEEFATFKESFLGKTVGDTAEVKVQGKDHVFTILGVRKKPDASTEK